MEKSDIIEFFNRCAPNWDAEMVKNDEIIRKILNNAQVRENMDILDKTTPRLIQFHTLKNAVNPPFLGGFSISGSVAA